MKKILFLCDIDNTLIHSFRHKTSDDVCVEYIDGKEQGFMTRYTARMLPIINKFIYLVPVTTRSVDQYKRIVWPEGIRPELAVVANGAILLKQGKVDRAWAAAADELVLPYRAEIDSLYLELRSMESYRCKIVDGKYVYIHCYSDEEAQGCAGQYSGHTALNVIRSGRKVYFFPPRLDKGFASVRLKETLKCNYTIAAGDSEIDVPMLELADMALIPDRKLASQISGVEKIYRAYGTVFSDFIMETIYKLIERGISNE